MSLIHRALALPILVVVFTCLRAEEYDFVPFDGVLVLRNGFVLEGRITPANDVFLVSVGASGEVRLPRAEVELQCRNLDEAYQHQRNALASDNSASHLKLAEWCLRHGLLHRAADQLLVVFAQEPSHPRLAVLEHRLLSLGGQPTAVPSTTRPTAEAPPPPVSVLQKVSPQAMQQFTTVVQPILLNRCATYACHGSGGTTQYRLIRPASGHATTSRMTHRNLQATLSYMDHGQPEVSPVLVQGGMAHGGSEAAPFSEKQIQQFELLAAWVRRAAVMPQEAITKSSGGPKRTIPRSVASVIPVDSSDPSDASPERAKKSAVVPAGHFEPAAPAANESARDPFDPAIFNRRYHSQTEPAPQIPSQP